MRHVRLTAAKAGRFSYSAGILARPDCKAIMESSLLHFDGVRYELGEFVVIPNHVHAIVAPIGEHRLTSILHSWKSFTKKTPSLGRSLRSCLPRITYGLNRNLSLPRLAANFAFRRTF
jgi:hypothetical protein